MMGKIFLMGSCALLLVGCASTTIYPTGDGSYSLVTTSSNEGTANSSALKKASAECQKQGKQLQVINHQTVYQGIPKDQKAMIDLADNVVDQFSHKKNNQMQMNNGTSSSNDYKVTMTFKCVK